VTLLPSSLSDNFPDPFDAIDDEVDLDGERGLNRIGSMILEIIGRTNDNHLADAQLCKLKLCRLELVK
jgi:hypothetical protein